MEQLQTLLEVLFAEEAVIQMVFSNPRKKSEPCRKVTLRPVSLKGELCYQAEHHYEKKALHENISALKGAAFCLALVENTYKQVNIFAKDHDYQVLASKPQNPHIAKTKATKEAAALNHNQDKSYLIPAGTPCDFLIHLGIMTKDGQVKPKHYNKFRQINRFLEIVSDVAGQLPLDKPSLKIIDFGCGKAYLTFALYYYLKILSGKAVEIVGLDLKEDVIRFCSETAAALGYDGLTFAIGDIADYDETAAADMVVTLHACDTATDLALIKAVGWNASVILSVPCCQHELFDQIENDINQPLLKQGILKERFSAILTDGLRALKLEEHGYQVSMIEFTSLEHTAKNIMIRAVRQKDAGLPGKTHLAAWQKKAAKEYEELARFWNVSPAIGAMAQTSNSSGALLHTPE